MVEARIGTLEFTDGMPSQETLDKGYDNLDFTYAFEVFVNSTLGVNPYALHKGLLDAGVKDKEIILFSKLVDAKTLILTTHADTLYTMGFLDLTSGPMVWRRRYQVDSISIQGDPRDRGGSDGRTDVGRDAGGS